MHIDKNRDKQDKEGLTDLNVTAPSPPLPDPSVREQARPQPKGLENQSVTQPGSFDTPRRQ